MPGPISHLIIQQRLPHVLKEIHSEKGQMIGELLLKEPCSSYANFGSMGPDFLFFSMKEYGVGLDDLVNFMFKVYDSLEPIINFYETTIAPVKQALENAIAAVDALLFKGLISQIQDTANLLSSALTTNIEALITKNLDLFYPFYPKVQKGAPEKDWYWCDYLHERRTGQFCSNLWKLAQGDDDLMRYSVGFACHIGTDVVGHPYVNALVGGPYRMHWHRHKLVENWIDAYARNYYPDSSTTISCLNLGAEDKYLPNAIAGSYYSRLCEFPDGKLPKKLGELLIKAQDQTYTGVPHPVNFNYSDMDTTYRLWLKWFEISTTIGSAVKPTPVPPPGSGVVTLINDYVSGFPSYSGGSGGSSGGGWGFIKWLAESLAYTFEWIVTHALEIVSLPFVEAIGLLKWLLYQAQLGLYSVYDNARWVLVMGGYIFPEPQDLAKQPWAKALLNTNYVQLMGGASANFNLFPRKQEVHNLFGPMEHHLIYQGTLQEKPHAEPAPYSFHGVYPETVLTKSHPYDPNIRILYACEVPYGTTYKATHKVDQNSWNTPQLGSCLSFSARLIAETIDKLPNFNLDGDRGYGWKTWRAIDPKNIELNNPVNVEYVDANW
jgi:hypothetical protein